AGDLSVREGRRFGAAEDDRAERDAFSHQGNAQYRAEAQAPRVLAAVGKLARLSLHVGDLHSPLVQHRSTSGCPAAQREGELADWPSGDLAVVGHVASPVTVPSPGLV